MVSVVIPAFNEEKHIAACLESFLHQTTKEQFEVILVDNASTDKTSEVAKTFEDKLPLRVISEPQKGRGYARKAGFEEAKGDIILSTDSDSMVPDDWIEKMLAVFADPKVVAVTGPATTHDLSKIKNLLFKAGMPVAMHIYRLLYRHYWLTGSNFAIRKSIYEQSGGFPQVNGLEDIDLGLRIYKLGKIKYQQVYVWTSGRRFKKPIAGLLDYWKVYVEYFWQNNREVHFPDTRN